MASTANNSRALTAPAPAAAEQGLQLVTFRVGVHRLGLDIRQVREINRVLDITPVQRAADHVRGLVNLRGQIVVIFDLGVRLGLDPSPISGRTHNVVLKQEDVALMVDEIGEVVTARGGQMEAPPANLGGVGGEYVRGVVKLDRELLMILDVEKILG